MFFSQTDNLDFIIGLSFHKLEQVTRHGSGGLLPFVLIRNALFAQPVLTTRPPMQQPTDSTKEAFQDQDPFKQEEEQVWLEACFDNLDDNTIQFDREDEEDEEDDEDNFMDDFGDMMFRSAAIRAGISPSYLAAAAPTANTTAAAASSSPGTSYFLSQHHHLIDHSADHLLVSADDND
ncbi:hypothetical protein BX666DRAFT_2024248 [Dichotomocladium elegans]|nr:hypothetical protein BX666DRAFT_2024248 [Dichotomocladium elegans]